MFLVPNGAGGRLLDWKTAAGIPWGILILFGSGIAIAKAFVASGLSAVLGELLAGFVEASHPLVLIGLLCFFVMFLTEITSNTATTTLLMPILAAAALAGEIDASVKGLKPGKGVNALPEARCHPGRALADRRYGGQVFDIALGL